jgi:hypothetical protein
MVRDKDDLWRNFPKKAIELDRRFATEEACRAYWIEARWDGEPACARCGSTVRVRRLRSPNEPHVGHAVGEDQEAIQGLVPGGVQESPPDAAASRPRRCSESWG